MDILALLPNRRRPHSFCDGNVCFCWAAEWTGRLQGSGPYSFVHPLRSSLASTHRFVPSPSLLLYRCRVNLIHQKKKT